MQKDIQKNRKTQTKQTAEETRNIKGSILKKKATCISSNQRKCRTDKVILNNIVQRRIVFHQTQETEDSNPKAQGGSIPCQRLPDPVQQQSLKLPWVATIYYSYMQSKPNLFLDGTRAQDSQG